MLDFLKKLLRTRSTRDLTDRHRAEERLPSSEERFRLLVEGVREYAIFMLDPQGRIVTWNTGAERMKGYSAEEIIGQHFSRFYAPEDVRSGKPGRELETAAAAGKYEEEGWRVRKDGSRFWGSVLITALHDERGNLRGFSKVTRDMTERKQAEEKLHRAHAELESRVQERTAALRDYADRLQEQARLLDLAHVLIREMQGRIIFWNEGATRMYGYTKEEAQGQVSHMLLRAQFPKPLDQITAELLRDDEWEGELVHTHKDGSLLAVASHWVLHRDDRGQPARVLEVNNDITELKQLRTILRDERELLRVTLASIGDAVITTDTAGRVTFLNAVAESLTGWGQQQAQGQPLEVVFPILHEQTGQPVENPVAKVLREGVVVGLGNHTVLNARDGSPRPIDDSAAPIRGASGQTVGVVLTFRDVTEQRQAQLFLRDSEARKTAILETALDGIITIDHEGKIVEFNPAAEKTFGYSRTEAMGREIAGLIIPPSLRERHLQGLAHYLATGVGPVLNKRIEMPALRADGTEFPVELAITRIDTAGPPVFTAYVRDIAERKRTERRRSARLVVTQILAQSRGLRDAAPSILRAVCEGLAWDMGLLWVLHPQDEVLRCEATWHTPSVHVEEFERGSRERTFVAGIGLPGRVWSSGRPAWIPDVGQDDNFPRAPVARQAGLHGAFGCPILLGEEVLGALEFFSSEVREPDPDLLEMMATLGGQIGQFMERRRAEQGLRDSEQRFARFMQHLPGLAWIKDLEGGYVYANEAAEKAFGIPRAELYGKTDEEVFAPEIAAPFRENDRRALQSGTGVQVIESLKHADSILHHSIVSKFPILGAEGTPVLVGGMAIDITDRLRAEEAILEADRRKDEFLAMLAHELRNPLAPIRNALHLMKMPAASPEAIEQARQVTERQIQHMGRLVDDLLDVSRIMRGHIELRKEPVELAAVISHAIEAAQPVLDAQGQELLVSLPGERVWLDADPARLTQVIGNLLNNAAKFSQRAGRVWLSAEHEENELVLRVKDEGVGIPPDLLSQVFDLFVQGDKSLERSQGGLGIGLTVVRKLVELHGGRVSASSEGLGKGSEFVVRLPLRQEAPKHEGPQTPDPPSLETLPRRVLVVDDNADAAQSIAMLLRLWGHAVRIAFTGPEALQAAEEYQPEIVMLDIGLPGMDGYEVARRLRRLPQFQRTVLTAVTGYGQEDDRRRSRDAGFDHHLTKPVAPDALQKIIANARLL